MNIFSKSFILGVFIYTPLVFSQSQPDKLDTVRVWAEKAQQQCFMKIHFDTFAYQDCLVSMAKEEVGNKPRELGIYYFAYVGAMDSVRTGMYGSKNTAWYFLKRFQKLQNALGINDQSLCATVPGNCEIRIAQILDMAKSSPPKPVDPDGAVPGGIHQH
jgi:hypothetical protein